MTHNSLETHNATAGEAGREGTTRRLPLAYWDLDIGSQGLMLGGLAIAQLAKQIGTPFYLFDEARLRSNIRGARAAATHALAGADLHYSFKTNAVPRVLELIRDEALGAEVISAREFRAALTAGFPGSRIVFNGPGKSDADLALAIEHGALIHVESASEAEALPRLAAALGRPARAGIRLNPDVYDERAHAGVRMGSRGTVFGLDPAGAEFARAVDVLASPSVSLESLSASIGTGIIDSQPFRRAVRVLAQTRSQLADRGIRISTVDAGGGFAVPSEVRYPTGAFDAIESGREVAVPSPEEIASFATVCHAIASELGPEPPDRCILEPGRLLVADAFHLIARVIRLKESGNQRFAVLDAARAQNALFVARGYHEMVVVGAPEASPTSCYTIVGPLCAAFDTFARGRALPELAEGDLIAILDVGAYNISAQSHWSFDPAPVIALRDRTAVPVPTVG